MTDLLAPFGVSPHAAKAPAAVVAPPRTPDLITEQLVLFATAAAVPLQRARTSRRWIGAIGAFLTASFASAGNESQPKRRHYPPRCDFLEDSCMAREMTRL
jgi:hypothetical protein